MTVCNDDHDEICYEGRVCPLCEANDKIRDLELELEKKEE